MMISSPGELIEAMGISSLRCCLGNIVRIGADGRPIVDYQQLGIEQPLADTRQQVCQGSCLVLGWKDDGYRARFTIRGPTASVALLVTRDCSPRLRISPATPA